MKLFPPPLSDAGCWLLAVRKARQRGIALIITLIMLSVITFMAITFLVLSHRERNAVSTTTDQTTARFAADSGFERAKTELLARMLTFTNAQNFDLLISTNYINANGLNGSFDPTNVNYGYLANGAVLSANGLLTNLANLWYDPRPPVVVSNLLTGANEFRYYLDLNRNRRFDTNGWLPVLSGNSDNPYYDAYGNLTNDIRGAVYSTFTGDPEWIGVLTRPDLPHSGSNQFVSRYAYLALPAGKTLDVNAIHNQALAVNAVHGTLSINSDGYLRNQGVGSWEINLAAFLADLNTNYWNADNGATATYYQYNRVNDLSSPNYGTAFGDALAFLGYRYDYNYTNLAPANRLFAYLAAPLAANNIDDYSDGPLMTGSRIVESVGDPVGNPWLGADNPVHYFTPQEFLDINKVTRMLQPLGFVDRLNQAGAQTNSYDRYTYYRLLAQLGTDSAPVDDRINVNYVNVGADGRTLPGMETNLISWKPEQFFTNAADRVLRLNSAIWRDENAIAFFTDFGVTNAFSVTNIPVLRSYTYHTTNGLATNEIFGYTPAVHRLLQQVANIYDACGDASSSNLFVLPPQGGGSRTLYAPHVFRPILRRNPGTLVTNVYIAGFREVTDTPTELLQRLMGTDNAHLMVDLQDPADRLRILPATERLHSNSEEPMVTSIPLIIGAKKGYPNFNKFALQNQIKVTRKLRFSRPPSGGKVNQTNQVYSLQISNAFGLQAWNSYNAKFPRNLKMIVAADIKMGVSNEFSVIAGPDGNKLTNRFVVGASLDIPANTWREYNNPQSDFSYIMPLFRNYLFLTNTEYVQATTAGGGSMNRLSTPRWDAVNIFRVPHLWLNLRSQVRFLLVDTADAGRIVDYVNLDSSEAPLNIFHEAQFKNLDTDAPSPGVGDDDPDPADLWQTNRLGNPQGNPVVETLAMQGIPTYGVWNQILISIGAKPVSKSFWESYRHSVDDKQESIGPFFTWLGSAGTNNESEFYEAPFNPTRTFNQYVRWEANDPLVHYTTPDLVDLLGNAEPIQWDNETKSPLKTLSGQNVMNAHHRPWGGNPNKKSETSPKTQFNPGVKDPLVSKSDDWDFPTNKLPNIGWLGRAHRGSPWQTVYLKSSEADLVGQENTWSMWSGNTNRSGLDASRARPARDRLLFDVFTATPNENAARGRLSVNQENLAAWSAVLSGVLVINPSSATPTVIQPAGFYTPAQRSPVAQIVAGINRARANTDPNQGPVFPGGLFSSAGDVLAAPDLTIRSPYLNTNQLFSALAGGINDGILERIPQQIMGLLTLDQSPRFVVYSYGQTLRPAEQSVFLGGGPFNKLCTNYQVTAEVTTRAVIRVEGSFDPRYTNDLVHPNPDAHGNFYPPRIVVEQFNTLSPD